MLGCLPGGFALKRAPSGDDVQALLSPQVSYTTKPPSILIRSGLSSQHHVVLYESLQHRPALLLSFSYFKRRPLAAFEPRLPARPPLLDSVRL